MPYLTEAFREYVINDLCRGSMKVRLELAERFEYPCDYTDPLSPELVTELNRIIGDSELAIEFIAILINYTSLDIPRLTQRQRLLWKRIIHPRFYLEFLRVFDRECAPEELALFMQFDDILNAPVADPTNVDDWNTFYSATFTSVVVTGNEVELFGGVDVVITPSLFQDNVNLLQIIDYAECVIEIQQDAFNNFNTGGMMLNTAIFNACVTVGDFAFYVLAPLTTVQFNALEDVGESAFQDVAMNIENSFNSLVTIADFGFAGSGISISNFDGVTTIGASAFSGCPALTDISFALCTSAGAGSFASCSATSATFDILETIPDMMFSAATSLATCSFPIATTAGDEAFNASGLTSITDANFPLLDTTGFATFGDLAFCVSIELTNLITCGHEDFSGEVGSTSILETMSLPSLVNFGNDCFGYHPLLTDLSLQSVLMPAFTDNPALTTVDFASATSITVLNGSFGANMVFANMPNVTDETGDQLFQTTVGNIITVNVNVILETIDGGNPAPWLVQLLIDNPGSTINYI